MISLTHKYCLLSWFGTGTSIKVEELNLEKTKRAFKNGQSRENQKDIQEWTIQVHWQHWAYKDTGQRKTNTTQHRTENYKKLKTHSHQIPGDEPRCSRRVISSCHITHIVNMCWTSLSANKLK